MISEFKLIESKLIYNGHTMFVYGAIVDGRALICSIEQKFEIKNFLLREESVVAEMAMDIFKRYEGIDTPSDFVDGIGKDGVGIKVE